MQAIFEPVFDIIYLLSVFILGSLILRRSRGMSDYQVFGAMTLLLGLGDAFHLVPRVLALWSGDFARYQTALGMGKLITSLSMTGFYLLLYYVWRHRYFVRYRHGHTALMYVLAVARVGLCLLPQNRWLGDGGSLAMTLLRNVPLCLMGMVMMRLFATESGRQTDKPYRFMPLAIGLSFAFYVPVLLLADKYPIAGMLMIPKTLAYVWMVGIGFKDMWFSVTTERA